MRESYRFIKSWSHSYEIVDLCEALSVSRSSYYAYIKGNSYEPSEAKQKKLETVKRVFNEHKGRYGSRRIQSVLHDEGYIIGIYQVRSLMKLQELKAIQPKSFVPRTTQSHPHLRRNNNLLLEAANLPNAPNKVWVGDITYLPSSENGVDYWLYLAVWMDLYSRKIVGWCVDKQMDETLVIRALKRGISKREVNSLLIIHSDGGGQYASNNFRALLERNKFHQSMTRKDNHYDNAHIESLFSRFKAELFHVESLYGLDDADFKIFDFIEGYYNTIRKHSALGYLSPMQFEEQFWRNEEQKDRR